MSHASELAEIVLSGIITFVGFMALSVAVDLIRRFVAIWRHRRAVRKSACRLASWPAPQQRPDRRTR